MKLHQRLYFEQAKSEWEMFYFLKVNGKPVCHCLHFLQMATEKLGKAANVKVPGKIHHGFVKFLRGLVKKKNIWKELGFGRREDFQKYLADCAEMAQSIEDLAPNQECAGDGPNPEYPWPPSDPMTAPVRHRFAEWDMLVRTTKGHKFQDVLQQLFGLFPTWF